MRTICVPGYECVKLPCVRNKTGKFSGSACALISKRTPEKLLVSYKTIVAKVGPDGSFHRTWNGWSVSTARHVRMFVAEYCPAMVGKTNKAQWQAMKVEKVC